MKQLTKYNRVSAYLNRIYDLCNEHYFESKLSKPVITIQSTPSAYGHVTIGDVWQTGEESHKELNIGAGTLDRPIENIVSTMLHEMVHIYNLEKGIKDTSRGLTYHNKLFKEKAEQCDLLIEHHDKYGWTITKPTDKLIAFCIENELSEIRMNRNELSGFSGVGGAGSGGIPTRPKKISSTRKYVCPCCKQSVRATKDVNIICADCNQIMLKADE